LKSATEGRSQSQRFATRIRRLLEHAKRRLSPHSEASSPLRVIALRNADPHDTSALNVVITVNEVNNLHGTGPLVKRICADWPNVLSIRSRDDYGGIHDFGNWSVKLGTSAATNGQLPQIISQILEGRNVETVVCVPFGLDDARVALAVQEHTRATLCAYVMDEPNIAGDTVPAEMMQRFFQRCSLRLTTHPEMRFVYESRYHLPFYLLPAVVPANLVATATLAYPRPILGRGAALVGSFWDQAWFDRLCAALTGCDREIDWFGNNKSPWFTFADEALARARIKPRGVIPETRLADQLKTYPFVLVPVGELNDGETNQGVARLSLPGRILFVLATANTPVLVVGSPRTCAARFVTQFGVGEVAPYDPGQLAAAMDRMDRPENQVRMRRNAARIATALSDRGIPDWLARSIAIGEPADRRFEDFFSQYDAAIQLERDQVAISASRGRSTPLQGVYEGP
jgi:hypothetical protein